MLLLIKLSIVNPDFFGFELVLDKLPELCKADGENCVEEMDVFLGDNDDGSDNSFAIGADGGGNTGGINGGKPWFPFDP